MGISKELSTRNRDGNRIKKQKQLGKKINRQKNQRTGEIEDKKLITKHIMKKRQDNPRTNITISKKKKSKLMKQLKHQAAFDIEAKARDELRGSFALQKPKNSMDVDGDVKKVKKTKKSKGNNKMDVDQ